MTDESWWLGMPWRNCECGCRDEVDRLNGVVDDLRARLVGIAALAELARRPVRVAVDGTVSAQYVEQRPTLATG